MTSSNPPVGELRPLPARPNLEFEKGRARTLARESGLSASTAPEATFHAEMGTETTFHAEARRGGELRPGVPGDGMKLSEAQLMIAREYGFSSWRRLSAYYKTWQQHELAGPTGWDLTQTNVDNEVAGLLEAANRVSEGSHAPETPSPTPAKHSLVLSHAQLSAIAAFVPRFYGLPNSVIRDAVLTEAEARLIVARTRRFPGWQALQERIDELARDSKNPRYHGAPPALTKPNKPSAIGMVRRWSEYSRRIRSVFTNPYPAIRCASVPCGKS